MRRVVVTGMGAVSCLGNSADEITDSLKNGRSGIVYNENFKEMGLRSHVSGSVNIDLKEHIDRKARRFMSDSAAYAYIAMQWAINDAGLEDSDVSNVRTGLIASSGGASSENIISSADTLRNRGVRKITPYIVPRSMSSTVSACLATPFKIKGVNYSITSACATSAHCIGNAAELIQLNKQDIVFAGGGEEEHWNLSSMFDAMGALSTQYNDEPTLASRPYDVNRDGFVSASGSGMLVIEELEHAKARGAKIYAELVGYGATSDGHDMVAPSGEGAYRCMELAKATTEGDVDYVNTHGTSTPVGDIVEVEAQEAIHCLLMLEHDFIAPSINVFDLDPALADMPPVTETIFDAGIRTAMSNSFGFGGTNATLVFQKL
jgi:3-oxoacyl-[acyl-carrier-protein] synthase-1